VNETDTIDAIVEALRSDPTFGDAFAQPKAAAGDSAGRAVGTEQPDARPMPPAQAAAAAPSALEMLRSTLSERRPAPQPAPPAVAAAPQPAPPADRTVAAPAIATDARSLQSLQKPLFGLATPTLPEPSRGTASPAVAPVAANIRPAAPVTAALSASTAVRPVTPMPAKPLPGLSPVPAASLPAARPVTAPPPSPPIAGGPAPAPRPVTQAPPIPAAPRADAAAPNAGTAGSPAPSPQAARPAMPVAKLEVVARNDSAPAPRPVAPSSPAQQSEKREAAPAPSTAARPAPTSGDAISKPAEAKPSQAQDGAPAKAAEAAGAVRAVAPDSAPAQKAESAKPQQAPAAVTPAPPRLQVVKPADAAAPAEVKPTPPGNDGKAATAAPAVVPAKAAAAAPAAEAKPAAPVAPENPVETKFKGAEAAWRRAGNDAARVLSARSDGDSADPTDRLAQENLEAALIKAEEGWKKAEIHQAAAERALEAAGAKPAPQAQARMVAARKKTELAFKKAGMDMMPAPVVAKAPAVGKAPVAPKPVTPAEAPPLQPALDKLLPVAGSKKARRSLSPTRLSFLLAVILPVFLVGLYYLFMSSDQYRSEMRFAVRGTETSSLENLGLNALTGSTTQAADAYIVIDYIHSKQVLLDIQQKLGIDVRKFFARPEIDFAYRIDPDMPLEEFIKYWRWMVDASYNSTTAITTFQVTAFNGDDAAEIAQAVLKVSDELVNELSTKARLKLISNAQAEVTRTEDRLVLARQAIAVFRDREQTANPTMIAESDQAILQGIEKTIIELKSRRASLLSSVDSNSPSVRVLDRQIASYTAELEEKRRGIGSGGQGTGDRTLTTQLTEYNALSLEQEFAEKAYTTALASLETSQAEARKQDRYFAIAVEPNVPEVALYPLRLVNTFICLCILSIVWLIGYLIVQAVRDHTV
jgi:capsular polysaccharide transport system permease protein